MITQYNNQQEQGNESLSDELKRKFLGTKGKLQIALSSASLNTKEFEEYYIPEYREAQWRVMVKCYYSFNDTADQVIESGEAFKTESDCKRYMNSKGWINDNKEWEV